MPLLGALLFAIEIVPSVVSLVSFILRNFLNDEITRLGVGVCVTYGGGTH